MGVGREKKGIGRREEPIRGKHAQVPRLAPADLRNDLG